MHSPVGVCEIELLDRRELFSIGGADIRKKQKIGILSLYGWLSALLMLKQIESQRASLVTVVWEVGESTSPQPRTVPRHICRHSPINETNGRLLTGTPPRLGMTYVDSRRCVPLQYAFMRGL